MLFKKLKNDLLAKTELFKLKESDDIRYLERIESFTIPDLKKINKYIDTFKRVFKKDTNKVANKLFKIIKLINQPSSNGIIYIVEIKKSKSKYAKLLIKMAKTKNADPTSYEYYVGRTLNELRNANIHNFSLVYGRFMCGFDMESIQQKKDICNSKAEQKTHILYEYIATESGETETLKSFILKINEYNRKRMSIELMNIFIMLMISLQHAQDKLDFTHYDLHLENILLVKLNSIYKFKYEYGGKIYDVVLEYFPFIIDYGRSHINPEKVDEIVQETIIDTDKNRSYDNFRQYQKECWENTKFELNTRSKSDRTLIIKIRSKIAQRLLNPKFRKEVLKNINKKSDEEFIDDDLDIDLVIEAYYTDDNSLQVTNGLHPDRFHKSFDFYRLIRSACDYILQVDKTLDFWLYLDRELEKAYPFYIPYYFNLPSDYESFTNRMNIPIDIAEYMYDITSEFNMDIKVEKNEISYKQLGGGNKIKGINKIVKEEYKRVESKLYKKIKNYRK